MNKANIFIGELRQKYWLCLIFLSESSDIMLSLGICGTIHPNGDA